MGARCPHGPAATPCPTPRQPPYGSPRYHDGLAYDTFSQEATTYDLGPGIVDAPGTGRVFLVGYPGILTLDARTGALLRSVAAAPDPLALDAATHHVFAVGRAPSAPRILSHGGILHMLDATSGRVLRTVAIGSDADALAVDERRHRVFLVGGAPDSFIPTPATIVEVDTRSGVVLAIIAGHGGRKVGVDERTGHLFALTDDGVTIIDPTR